MMLVYGLTIAAPRPTGFAAFLVALALAVPVGGLLWLADLLLF